jgi:bifunctional non-homologous end joining protein LigD
VSRRGLELAPFFPEIVGELAQQAVGQMILDGEIVAFGADARPSFNLLQQRAQLKEPAQIERAQRDSPAALVCFDLLHFAGLNLRTSAYSDRRRYLAQCLLPSPHLQLVHVEDDADSLYRAALANGFEGVVAKRRDSPYESGRRSGAWRKYKATRSIEMVVGGYTRGKGSREALGALLLGYWRARELCFAGHVGSGLDAATLETLRARLAPLSRERSPFAAAPSLHRPTSWVAPKLVVEVTFAEWTPDGMLRAPVFVRVRDDVEARGVTQGPTGDRATPGKRATRTRGAARSPRREPEDALGAILQQLDRPGERLDLELEGGRLRLTNLNRVYWPADARRSKLAVTKRDLIRYLAAVARYMLPHLRDRPLTMIRMPEGIDGERFFQKHWEHTLPPFVETVQIFSGHRGERQDYLLANNLATLLWLAQNGTLEFHIWHSRAAVEADALSRSRDFSSSLEALEPSVLNYPDYLVFDIDPYIYSGHEPRGGEPELSQRGFDGGKRVAFWLRELLAQMSLEAFVKTSGKTGLHIFVPIERSVTFDAAREICESIGRHLLAQHPSEITMEWAVQKRTGKIFIDYNMNVRGKTLNVAYSPRGVLGAPVSMPLTWEELESAEPLDFAIDNVIPRLERLGDRWHDLPYAKQSLARAFGRIRRT